EQPLLRLEPELGEPVRRKLARAATLVVRSVLVPVHRDLPERRRDRVLDATREQVELAARVVLLGEQRLEGERLAEDRCRLGCRQRGGRVVEAERLCQYA